MVSWLMRTGILTKRESPGGHDLYLDLTEFPAPKTAWLTKVKAFINCLSNDINSWFTCDTHFLLLKLSYKCH